MPESPINGYRGPADLRDVHNVRDLLLIHIEEQRAHNALVSERLGLTKAPEGASLVDRWRRWTSTISTNRVVLDSIAIATILSVAGSVAALPVARAIWPLQKVPPHSHHEVARAEK